MILDRIAKFLSSLKLTVVLLGFAILLVWIGTVAQADEGLYQAQTRYFKSWFVFGMNMFGHHVPMVWPGGYLLGSTLLVNLIAAHISRFQFTWKKLGIHIAHAGIILLLVGQLITDIFSRETQIRFSEGETKSFAESPSNYELVFVTSADAEHNQEIAIPSRLLAKGGVVTNPQLPFSVRVKSYYHNSYLSFRAPVMQNGPAMTTNGVAANFDFFPQPDSKTMDARNVPTTQIEIIGPNGSLGDWVVSDWMTEPAMLDSFWQDEANQVGGDMARVIVSRLNQPQGVQLNGKAYSFVMRPERIWMPFSLTLLKATHSVYAGTDIPKDFRSRVRLQNPGTGEDRETEIYMNSPLRYAGLTFYQLQMAQGDVTARAPWSTLQVIRNPSWLTPYLGCLLVAAGLLIQFLSHLVKFISRKKTAEQRVAGGAPVANGAANGVRKEKRALQESVRK